MPNVSYFGQVVGNAFAIAVVGYAICISLGKIFALKHGYKVDSNQVMLRRAGPLPWVKPKLVLLAARGRHGAAPPPLCPCRS